MKFDIMAMITNLVKVENDFCQDRILEIGIIGIILKLIHDARHGANVTMYGLDAIDEIFDQYECFAAKLLEVQKYFEEASAYGDDAIMILESLTFSENTDIQDRAINILEKHFQYHSDFFNERDEKDDKTCGFKKEESKIDDMSFKVAPSSIVNEIN